MRFAWFRHKSSTPAQNKWDCSVPQLCFVDSKLVTRNVFSSPTRKYLSQPSCQQPEQQSLGGRPESWRFLAEREKFAQHVMVSVGVCFGGKGRLHFVDESAKVDSTYYVGRLLPSLVDDCTRLLPSGYTGQQTHFFNLYLSWFYLYASSF